MHPNSSKKTYDIFALEQARISQGLTYGQLAQLASLTYRQVNALLSPASHALQKREFKYYRCPNNILRIAFALQLKEDQYIKEVEVV